MQEILNSSSTFSGSQPAKVFILPVGDHQEVLDQLNLVPLSSLSASTSSFTVYSLANLVSGLLGRLWEVPLTSSLNPANVLECANKSIITEVYIK